MSEHSEIVEARAQKVVKANEFIQKSRYNLTLTEMKVINFMISLIKPKQNAMDVQPLEYEFRIVDFCKICGFDSSSGKNYEMVRDTLKSLDRKKVLIMNRDGSETDVSWINKFWINKDTGKVRIRWDDDVAKELMDLLENTTRFELLNVLPMKSKYSIRLYEICRSWARIGRKEYTIEELRDLLSVGENELTRYPDFRRNVLEIAEREINEYTDLKVLFEPVKEGRKVTKIILHIKEKKDKYLTQSIDNDILDKKAEK